MSFHDNAPTSFPRNPANIKRIDAGSISTSNYTYNNSETTNQITQLSNYITNNTNINLGSKVYDVSSHQEVLDTLSTATWMSVDDVEVKVRPGDYLRVVGTWNLDGFGNPAHDTWMVDTNSAYTGDGDTEHDKLILVPISQYRPDLNTLVTVDALPYSFAIPHVPFSEWVFGLATNQDTIKNRYQNYTVFDGQMMVNFQLEGVYVRVPRSSWSDYTEGFSDLLGSVLGDTTFTDAYAAVEDFKNRLVIDEANNEHVWVMISDLRIQGTTVKLHARDTLQDMNCTANPRSAYRVAKDGYTGVDIGGVLSTAAGHIAGLTQYVKARTTNGGDFGVVPGLVDSSGYNLDKTYFVAIDGATGSDTSLVSAMNGVKGIKNYVATNMNALLGYSDRFTWTQLTSNRLETPMATVFCDSRSVSRRLGSLTKTNEFHEIPIYGWINGTSTLASMDWDSGMLVGVYASGTYSVYQNATSALFNVTKTNTDPVFDGTTDPGLLLGSADIRNEGDIDLLSYSARSDLALRGYSDSRTYLPFQVRLDSGGTKRWRMLADVQYWSNNTDGDYAMGGFYHEVGDVAPGTGINRTGQIVFDEFRHETWFCKDGLTKAWAKIADSGYIHIQTFATVDLFDSWVGYVPKTHPQYLCVVYNSKFVDPKLVLVSRDWFSYPLDRRPWQLYENPRQYIDVKMTILNPGAWTRAIARVCTTTGEFTSLRDAIGLTDQEVSSPVHESGAMVDGGNSDHGGQVFAYLPEPDTTVSSGSYQLAHWQRPNSGTSPAWAQIPLSVNLKYAISDDATLRYVFKGGSTGSIRASSASGNNVSITWNSTTKAYEIFAPPPSGSESAVTSVNTKTGAVSLATADIPQTTGGPFYWDPSWVTNGLITGSPRSPASTLTTSGNQLFRDIAPDGVSISYYVPPLPAAQVTSVNGRSLSTGGSSATVVLTTTHINEGTNLYWTMDRVYKRTDHPYDDNILQEFPSVTGEFKRLYVPPPPVTSVSTRTGDVTLTTEDILERTGSTQSSQRFWTTGRMLIGNPATYNGGYQYNLNNKLEILNKEVNNSIVVSQTINLKKLSLEDIDEVANTNPLDDLWVWNPKRVVAAPIENPYGGDYYWPSYDSTFPFLFQGSSTSHPTQSGKKARRRNIARVVRDQVDTTIDQDGREMYGINRKQTNIYVPEPMLYFDPSDGYLRTFAGTYVRPSAIFGLQEYIRKSIGVMAGNHDGLNYNETTGLFSTDKTQLQGPRGLKGDKGDQGKDGKAGANCVCD